MNMKTVDVHIGRFRGVWEAYVDGERLCMHSDRGVLVTNAQILVRPDKANIIDTTEG